MFAMILYDLGALSARPRMLFTTTHCKEVANRIYSPSLQASRTSELPEEL